MSDYDDWDDSSEWSETEEHYRCLECGHVGVAEGLCKPEIQGDGVMTGMIMVATGDARCIECESENLEEVEHLEGKAE